MDESGLMTPVASAQPLMLHPQWAALDAKRRQLREELTGLHQRLEEQKLYADHLQARFKSLIGPLEIERLRAQAEGAYWRVKHAAIARQLSDGAALRSIDMQAIEREAQAARAQWDARVRGEIQQLSQGKARVATAIAVPEATWAEVKRLYRALCRRLHPDVSDADPQAFEVYWPLVQQAYRGADVEMLATLSQIIPATTPATAALDSWSVLRMDIHRLEELARGLVCRLAENERNPPLCFATQLDDAQWIDARCDALRREVAVLDEECARFRAEAERATSNKTLH